MAYDVAFCDIGHSAVSSRVKAIRAAVREILKDPADPRELELLAATLAFCEVQANAAMLRRRRPRPREAESDQWVAPVEAAKLLSVHRKWLDRRWHRLPYCHPLDPDDANGKGYRVSVRELTVHMRRRGR